MKFLRPLFLSLLLTPAAFGTVAFNGLAVSELKTAVGDDLPEGNLTLLIVATDGADFADLPALLTGQDLSLGAAIGEDFRIVQRETSVNFGDDQSFAVGNATLVPGAFGTAAGDAFAIVWFDGLAAAALSLGEDAAGVGYGLVRGEDWLIPTSGTYSFAAEFSQVSAAGRTLAEVTEPPGPAPVFTGVPVVLWVQGQAHTASVFAFNPEGLAIELAADLDGLPGAAFTDAGDGSAVLSWDPSAASPGLYEVPLTATSNRATTEAVARIVVASDNAYWQWAADVFGTSFAADFDLARLQKTGDFDGDGRPNVHEFALLTDPLQPDNAPVHIRIFDSTPHYKGISLSIDRRAGSQEFVRFGVVRALSLEGPWEPVPPVDMVVSIDRHGPSGDAGRQTLQFDIFEFHEGEIPQPSFFYMIETTTLLPED
jgi:hypothetical protein